MVLLALLAACTRTSDTDSHDESATSDTAEVADDRVWERVTPYPCGIDAEGRVECWRSVRWDDFVGNSGALNHRVWPLEVDFPVQHLFAPTGAPVWAVRADTGEAVKVQCLENCGHPPQFPYSEIGRRCGRHGERITCFGVDPVLFDSTLRYTHLAYDYAGGGTFGSPIVASTTANTVVFPAHPAADYAFPDDVEIEELVGYNTLNACALTSTGDILCVGANPPSFDNPPYEMLSGENKALCAARADWLIECTDGSTFDFGPLRHLEVASLAYWVPNEPDDPLDPIGPDEPAYEITYPTLDDPPHVCVVTQDNAIRCAGPHYDYPDLQQALPAGD